MSDHHRGRSRRGYYDDDYYYGERPRHRSLGRQALTKLEDKLEDAMRGLGLESSHSTHSKALVPYDDDRHHHRPSSPRRHYTRDSHWDHGHHHRRAYHSASPSRHHHHRHHSHHRHHHDDRGRHETRHAHDSSASRSRSRFKSGITAAVDAAALEAFRLRKEPGPWKGKKGERIATAAISAGMIGAAAAADHGDGKHDSDLGGKGALGSAIGGLMVNRLVNGPRKEVRTSRYD